MSQRGGRGGEGPSRGRGGGRDGRGGGNVRGRGRRRGNQGPYRGQSRAPQQSAWSPSPAQTFRPQQSTQAPGTPPPPQQQQSHPQRSGPPQTPTTSSKSIAQQGSGEHFKSREIIAKGGSKGRVVSVLTNHFPFKRIDFDRVVIHYHVVIEPDRPKRQMRLVMEQFKQTHYPTFNPAYDGAHSLYSPRPLPFGQEISETISVIYDDRPKDYKVVIKEVARISMSDLRRFFEQVNQGRIVDPPQLALQVLDVVLRHSLSKSHIPVGNSLFPIQTAGRIVDLGSGMLLYRGMSQSVSLGWKPFLNVDVANKAFPSAANIIELIKAFQGRCQNVTDRLSDWVMEKLQKHLRTLKVKYEIPRNASSKRNYRVNGVRSNSFDYTFDHEGSQINVATYYEHIKGYKIRYPLMPLLWVGSTQSRVMVPAELCTVLPGQPVNRKCDEWQTRKMIRECATNTHRRKAEIMHNVQNAHYNDDAVVQEFGLAIADEMEKVEARILTPPRLMYKNNSVAPVARGKWHAKEFVVSGRIKTGWTVLNLDRNTRLQDMQNVIENAKNCGKQLGIDMRAYIDWPSSGQLRRNREMQDLQKIFADIKERGLDLVIVILPNDDRIYNYVKHAAEIAVGCLTQCLRSQTVQNRMNATTMRNILLKVNAKLAGTNHLFATLPQVMKDNCVMLMGADVTHPGPDNPNGFSVAAVTASHCPGAFGYNVRWSLQQPGQEIIQNMEEITRTHLTRFYQRNNHMKPEKIIVFRDGVSTGQFDVVLQDEMQAIRRACKSKDEDYQPAITFIVVQKRHHTRFFPEDESISEDDNMNVPAGTVVDKTITHPTRQDFYLVSHASIQGVAKPTKYVTLWDDSDISDDDLEELTYYLCHMFSRCTRSVSYPAPTYYAHLAAARGKAYCDAKGNINVNNLENEQRMLTIKDSIIENCPMFFV